MKNENGVDEVGGDLTVGCKESEHSECAILGDNVEVGMEALASILMGCSHQCPLAPSRWDRLP
jgi:hypothetical protein